MAARGTFDSKRAQARELYDEGYSCRAIAERLDAAPSTVSKWAKDEGLAFDHSQTDLATRAHTVDLAAERLLLTKEMVVAARDGLAELDSPFTVFSFGGKENTYAEHTFDRPPPDIRRQALTTAGIAFDKATKVLEKEVVGIENAHSLLGSLARGFEKAAAEYEATVEPDGA